MKICEISIISHKLSVKLVEFVARFGDFSKGLIVTNFL